MFISFWQLFLTNFKMLYRNWRGLFFNIFLPVFLYLAISKISGNAPGSNKITYSEYLLPGIIAMTIMQTGIFSLAYWLVDLKARGVIKRLLVTPLSNFEMVGSLIASRLVLMAIQIGLIISIGIWYFKTSIPGSGLAILLLMIMGGAVFLGIGFAVSSFAKTFEEAAPITTILNLLFTFLGNIFFPTNNLPVVLKVIASKLPITYLAEGMRDNFVQEWTLKQTLPDLLGLGVWLVIVMIILRYTAKLKQD
ncbi:MAG: ABC transporter permease [Candidatus Doudnabacteria bacterium]